MSIIMTTAYKLTNISFHVNAERLGTIMLSGLSESYRLMIVILKVQA